MLTLVSFYIKRLGFLPASTLMTFKNMECNTFLVLKTILRLTLAITFLCLFFKSIWKVVLNEKSFRITVEEPDSYFPALNICPYYKEKSLIIKSKDNYTLKDLDKLPSLVDIIQIEIEVYKEGSGEDP